MRRQLQSCLRTRAEHGYNSPACLITPSRKLAEGTLAEIDRLLQILPTAETASVSWRDYGDVILCDTHDEMLQVANDMAYEHVQVMTDRDDWYLERMHSYGALFLGARTNVANGDKVIGTNHTPSLIHISRCRRTYSWKCILSPHISRRYNIHHRSERHYIYS